MPHKWVIFDVYDAEQNRIVNVGDAIPPSAHRGTQKGCGMMELDTVHLRSDDTCQAIVSRRTRIHRSQREAWHPFVDLLRDQRYVKEQL